MWACTLHRAARRGAWARPRPDAPEGHKAAGATHPGPCGMLQARDAWPPPHVGGAGARPRTLLRRDLLTHHTNTAASKRRSRNQRLESCGGSPSSLVRSRARTCPARLRTSLCIGHFGLQRCCVDVRCMSKTHECRGPAVRVLGRQQADAPDVCHQLDSSQLCIVQLLLAGRLPSPVMSCTALRGKDSGFRVGGGVPPSRGPFKARGGG